MSKLNLSRNSQSNEGNTPVVSVLMPVFNGEKYLAEAVESILNQSFSDFEFIVMDDGSTDNTLNLLRQYAEIDSRLCVIAKEHRGLGATQHELVHYAQGEFIAHMDADDIALPKRLGLQVEFLKGNPNVVVVGGACQMIDSAGRYLTTLTPPQTDEEIQSLVLGGHGAITHSCAMMRSVQLKLIDGYDKSFNAAMDLDLWLRLGEVGELANLPTVLLKYRLHDKSISETKGNHQRDAARRACENAYRRRNVPGVFSAQNLWRPGADRSSQFAFMLKYGWWAWNSRQRKTAAYYGWQAIKKKPLSRGGWKLLMVALIKPLAVAERG
jgi:glycosyltransferase involved in cell wall biosynthesis